jgi:hypothetical protein
MRVGGKEADTSDECDDTVGFDPQYIAVVGIVVTLSISCLVWSGRVVVVGKDDTERVKMAKLCVTIGFLLSAMIPQLCATFIHGSHATNKIMPSFLIIAVVSLLFKLSAMKTNTPTEKLLVIAAFIPMIFHYIWLVQVAVYNNGDAVCSSQTRAQLANKRIATVFGVLLGICIVIIVVHMMLLN